jgi:hypothetical protein
MLATTETHELEIERVETYDLSIEEQPSTRQTRPGFWRMLMHGISTYLTPTRHKHRAPVCRVSRPFETPMDQLVREHPSLATYVLSMI